MIKRAQECLNFLKKHFEENFFTRRCRITPGGTFHYTTLENFYRLLATNFYKIEFKDTFFKTNLLKRFKSYKTFFQQLSAQTLCVKFVI